jgi:signal transduction histidine kinase
VHLSLWLDADRPVLLVEDNGLGFDVDRHRDELFHLFRRFHDHTEGTGVGLYLVNRIVQSNGGRVEVESEVGVGSTFRLYL